MTREQLRARTAKRIADSKLSLRAFARQSGCDASHLCHFLKHGARPVPQVVAALGYRLVDERYERAE